MKIQKYLLFIILISGVIMLSKLFSNQEDEYDNKYKNTLNKLKRIKWDDSEKIKDLIQPAIELIEIEGKAVPKGGSKMGGTPDLPENINWPKYQNESMIFIAQINLENMAKYHRNDIIPKSGILYFFTYFPKPINEFGAEFYFYRKAEEFKVIYFDGLVSDLIPTSFPEDLFNGYRYEEKKIEFNTFFQLPAPYDNAHVELSDLSENDLNLLEEYNDYFVDGLYDQILGIPTALQDRVDLDWALNQLGIDYEEYEKRKSEIDNLRLQYINLFTFHLFGNVGDNPCYFGILKKDLKERNFDNVVMIIQGT